MSSYYPIVPISWHPSGYQLNMKVQTGSNRRGIVMINHNGNNNTTTNNRSVPELYNNRQSTIPQQTESEQGTSSRLMTYHQQSIGTINGLSLPNTKQYFSKGSTSFRQQNRQQNKHENRHENRQENINTSNINTSNINRSNVSQSNINASEMHISIGRGGNNDYKNCVGERLQSIRLSNLSKISKLDSELDDIEKMKMIFQSKKSKADVSHSYQRSHTQMSLQNNNNHQQNSNHFSNHNTTNKRNINAPYNAYHNEQQSHSQHKSSEKHRVKPSNTPSFSKPVPVRQFNSSESISIRQTPRQVNPTHSKNIPPINPYAYTYNSNSNSHSNSNTNSISVSREAHTHSTSPVSESFKFQKPEMISYNTQQYQHEQDDYFDHCQAIEQEAEAQNQHYRKRNADGDGDEQHFTTGTYVNKGHCCEVAMGKFMEEVSMQMNSLLERIAKLESVNAGLLQRNQQYSQSNTQYKGRIKALQAERKDIESECDKYKQEKEELEALFKDVLFKREKEKLKQNINNDQQPPDRISISKPLLNQQSSYKSESKLKVQNLLQKLHIKVEK